MADIATIDGDTRKYAAALGRRHLEGTVTVQTLFEHFGGSADPLIQALLQGASRQPRRGFFGVGVGERAWRRHFLEPFVAVIEELEKGEQGRFPVERLYPPTSPWVLLVWGLFTLWAGASLVEGLLQWLGVLAPRPRGRLDPLTMTLQAIATVIGIAMLHNEWWMYRARKGRLSNRRPPP
jgi:hypothetical protein